MNWEERSFEEFFKIRHGYAFKSEYYSREGKYILLTPGNFYEEGGFKDKGKKETYYIGDVPEDYILNKDDLLVAMTEQAEGLLGSSALIPENNLYLYNQRLGLVIDLDEEVLDKKFLYHLFNSRSIRRQIHSGAGGTKVRHTSPDKILKTKFLYLPIPIQHRIADILSRLDQRINCLSKLIAAKTNLKRGLMQQLLTGRKRFQDFVIDQGFHLTRFGSIPNDWEYLHIGDIAHARLYPF